jgi:hypothetical protein
LGQSATGIFHPKLLVAGAAFGNDGTIEPVSLVYVGSANLTRRGLTQNTECGLVAETDANFNGASNSFAQLWNMAGVADDAALRNYAATFAEINRRRPSVDLEALDVSEKTTTTPPQTAQILATKPPKRSAVDNEFVIGVPTGQGREKKPLMSSRDFFHFCRKKMSQSTGRLPGGGRNRWAGNSRLFLPI